VLSFADLHMVILIKKASRERKRHLERAVAKAKQVVMQESRQKG
jgi:hypothetical protein